MNKRILALMLSAVMLTGCSPADKGISDVAASDKSSAAASSSSAASVPAAEDESKPNEGDMVMHDYAGSNFVYSPVSLNTALAMLNEGTSEEAGKEITDFIGNADYKKFVQDSGNRKDYKVADSLWTSREYQIKDSFRNAVISDYNAEAKTVDFNRPSTSAEINRWVSDNTNGLIKDIVTRENLTQMTAAILINTIYFNDTWVSPFSYTDSQDFKNTDSSISKVDMMHGNMDSYFEYGNSLAGIVKKYSNGCSFIAAKSKNGAAMTGDNSSISAMIKASASPVAYDEEILDLPKYTIDTTEDKLKDELTASGVTKIFDAESDSLSGISDAKLYVDSVLQKAHISVDESGTEASAATEIGINATCVGTEPASSIEVNFNTPFIYAIVDESGNVLFEGYFGQAG